MPIWKTATKQSSRRSLVSPTIYMSETDQILVQLGAAHAALSQARFVQDAKKIADVAVAAHTYARRVKMSQETIDYALEIKLRAERLLGQMLAKTPNSKTGPKQLSTAEEPNSAPTLEELGIDKKLSSQAQRLAAVPTGDFESRLAAGERRAAVIISESSKEEVSPQEHKSPKRRQNVTDRVMNNLRYRINCDAAGAGIIEWQNVRLYVAVSDEAKATLDKLNWPKVEWKIMV
jgi:hypothetical protein